MLDQRSLVKIGSSYLINELCCSYNSVVIGLDVQEFEWDEVKARINRKKHGIDFEEAVKVFLDEFALTEIDRFIEGEERWQTIGMLGENAIAHAERRGDG
jgi:uncharacterized DUF497 family protein